MESAGRPPTALGLLLQRVVGGGRHVTAICVTGVFECTRLYMTVIVDCVLSTRCKLFFCIRRRRTVLPFCPVCISRSSMCNVLSSLMSCSSGTRDGAYFAHGSL
jgi:hypothetical protein